MTPRARVIVRTILRGLGFSAAMVLMLGAVGVWLVCIAVGYVIAGAALLLHLAHRHPVISLPLAMAAVAASFWWRG